MRTSDRTPTLGGARLDQYYHACGFFRSRDEAYDVLLPFVAEGLGWGEKAVHITNPSLRDDHLHRLRSAGVDVDGVSRSGHLEVLIWEDAYLRDGRFDPDSMVRLLEDVIHANRERGFPGTRIIGDMGWALEDRPGVKRVMEYEARVNHVLARHREPAVCAYDITKIDAQTMLNVLRTHPLVIIGATLKENPFFMPPDEFLERLPA